MTSFGMGRDESEQERAEQDMADQARDEGDRAQETRSESEPGTEPATGLQAPGTPAEWTGSDTERSPGSHAPREDADSSEAETRDQPRVAVVDERDGGSEDEDEYQWHTGTKRPTGREDAVEFIDVHKSFGRNRILRGLNMGLP